MNKDTITYIIGILIVLIFLYLIIIRAYKNIKMFNNRKDLIKDNLFIKNSKEKLEKIIDDNSRTHKVFFALILISIICLIAFFILMVYTNNETLKYSCIFMIIASFLAAVFIHGNYKSKFEENVIKKIINIYNNSLEYNQFKGISKQEYDKCFFPEKYNKYYSKSLIINTNLYIEVANISLESEHGAGDKLSHYTKEYVGSLAKTDIKNINCEIFLGSTNSWQLTKNNYYIPIKLENTEFNDLFSAYTNNESTFHEVITSDVAQQLVDLKKKVFCSIDIRILNDKLYVRFLSGNNFIPSLFSYKIEKENIISSIAVLEETFMVVNDIKEIIENNN